MRNALVNIISIEQKIREKAYYLWLETGNDPLTNWVNATNFVVNEAKQKNPSSKTRWEITI